MRYFLFIIIFFKTTFLYQQDCLGKKLLLEEKKINIYSNSIAEENLNSIILEGYKIIQNNKSKTPSIILEQIGYILFKNGYRYFENNYPYSKALEEKTFDCDQFCITYLSIAQELKLPIYAILMPDHMMLKWQDEKSNIYWETVQNTEISEINIIENFNKKHQSIKNESIFYKVTQDKENAIIEMYLGDMYLLNNDFNNAKTYLEKAYHKLPNLNLIRNNLGTIYQNTNNNIVAKKLFTECINSDSTDYKSYNNLGLHYHKIGDYNSAKYYYNKAIYFNNLYSNTYNNLGLTYGHIGEFENAIRNFDIAISINNKDSEYYMNKGVCYIYLKKFKEAEICLTTAFNLSSNNPDIMINMAIIKENLGKKTEACIYLNKAKEIGSSQAEYYYNKMCK